jgi:hypothetical protein
LEFLIVLAQIELFLFEIHSGGATEAMGSANNGDSVNARGRPRGGSLMKAYQKTVQTGRTVTGHVGGKER